MYSYIKLHHQKKKRSKRRQKTIMSVRFPPPSLSLCHCLSLPLNPIFFLCSFHKWKHILFLYNNHSFHFIFNKINNIVVQAKREKKQIVATQKYILLFLVTFQKLLHCNIFKIMFNLFNSRFKIETAQYIWQRYAIYMHFGSASGWYFSKLFKIYHLPHIHMPYIYDDTKTRWGIYF